MSATDQRVDWGISYDVAVFNPDDFSINQNVPGAQDSQGNMLVDLLTTDSYGIQYSVANGKYETHVSNDGTHDQILFHFTDLNFPAGEVPLGAVTALVRLVDGAVLDTAIVSSPYKDSNGAPTLPPVKCPILVYPYLETISDTTPTLRWQPLAAPHADASTWFNLHLEFQSYYWGIYLPWEATKVSFPNTPEYPDASQVRIPADPEFPSHLPIGVCLVNLIAAPTAPSALVSILSTFPSRIQNMRSLTSIIFRS